MPTPQDISVFLNNALRPDHYPAQLDSDTALPDVIRDMPDRVSGQFVGLDAQTAHDIGAAWKRVMIFNATNVLYTFTFDAGSQTFAAQKR